MTNPIRRHPDAATLMSYAAGTLSEPLAAVVAAHLAVCEGCCSEMEDLELIGAGLLASLPPAVGSTIQVPARPLDGELRSAQARARIGSSDRLPAPIAQAYGLSFDTIPWKRLGPGVWHHRLPLSAGLEGDLRLLKIGPGREMPDHGHGGSELTLVLDGAYGDETGEYRRGDIQDVDEEIEHRPVADKQVGCVCLIASERPAKFKSIVGKLLQPWTGM
jgi:putative transcriptional regulator